jgi:threonine dehydrogenase-like Zn-dependent dehydrogenase
MHAVTLRPREAGSQRLDQVPEPSPDQGSILVRALAVGICGTDRELVQGRYGEAQPGRERLVLGHESLGRVLSAPAQSGFAAGDLVVGVVRHPDPVPCENCAVGEWDMCRNGLFTERGIRQADGFCAQEWRSSPGFTVRVNPGLGLTAVLLEPASVVAKAWEHIERIGQRAHWAPRRALVTGAGPVGLMAAMIGVQRGLEVHVMDRNRDGPKPKLVRDLGAAYHDQFPALAPDVVIECTGVPQVIARAVESGAPGSVVCLAGLGGGQQDAALDAAKLNEAFVLGNRVVLGTVNANLRHYHAAADALGRASRAWLERIITRRVRLERWQEAYERRSGDVKTVLLFED